MHSKNEKYRKLAQNFGISYTEIPSFELDEKITFYDRIKGTEVEDEFINYFLEFARTIKREKTYAGCDLGGATTSVAIYYLSALCDDVNIGINDRKIFNYLYNALSPEIRNNMRSNYELLKSHKDEI